MAHSHSTAQQRRQTFLDNLPVPQKHDNEETTCPICLDPYSTTLNPECAVVLPCNHILGRKCVERWLENGGNSCPMCRCVVIPPPPPTSSSSSYPPPPSSSPPPSTFSPSSYEREREAALQAFRDVRRSMALVHSELDHLERVHVQLGYERRREVRRVERENERVAQRLRELVGRFPDLVGAFGELMR